jgi:hypothetical protein
MLTGLLSVVVASGGSTGFSDATSCYKLARSRWQSLCERRSEAIYAQTVFAGSAFAGGSQLLHQHLWADLISSAHPDTAASGKFRTQMTDFSSSTVIPIIGRVASPRLVPSWPATPEISLLYQKRRPPLQRLHEEEDGARPVPPEHYGNARQLGRLP